MGIKRYHFLGVFLVFLSSSGCIAGLFPSLKRLFCFLSTYTFGGESLLVGELVDWWLGFEWRVGFDGRGVVGGWMVGW